MAKRHRHPLVGLAKIIEETEQIMVDAEAWNRHNAGKESPLDFERSRIILAHCNRMLVAWGSGDRSLYSRLSEELVEVARAE